MGAIISSTLQISGTSQTKAAIFGLLIMMASGSASSSGFPLMDEYHAKIKAEAEELVREYAARKHAGTQEERKVKSARIEAAWERGMERQRVKNLQYIEDHKKDFSFGWGPWTHAETTVVGRGFNK